MRWCKTHVASCRAVDEATCWEGWATGSICMTADAADLIAQALPDWLFPEQKVDITAAIVEALGAVGALKKEIMMVGSSDREQQGDAVDWRSAVMDAAETVVDAWNAYLRDARLDVRYHDAFEEVQRAVSELYEAWHNTALLGGGTSKELCDNENCEDGMDLSSNADFGGEPCGCRALGGDR